MKNELDFDIAPHIDLEAPCIPHVGRADANGYGRKGRNGAQGYAHRRAYEAAYDPIPKGMTVDHVCCSADLDCAGGPSDPHRLCVQPAHLELATQAENSRRAHAKPRRRERRRGARRTTARRISK